MLLHYFQGLEYSSCCITDTQLLTSEHTAGENLHVMPCVCLCVTHASCNSC